MTSKTELVIKSTEIPCREMDRLGRLVAHRDWLIFEIKVDDSTKECVCEIRSNGGEIFLTAKESEGCIVFRDYIGNVLLTCICRYPGADIEVSGDELLGVIEGAPTTSFQFPSVLNVRDSVGNFIFSAIQSGKKFEFIADNEQEIAVLVHDKNDQNDTKLTFLIEHEHKAMMIAASCILAFLYSGEDCFGWKNIVQHQADEASEGGSCFPMCIFISLLLLGTFAEFLSFWLLTYY